MVEARAQVGGSRYKKGIKSIRTKEKQRISSTCIFQVHGKGRNGSMLVVLAPNKHRELKKLFERRDIKKVFCRNTKSACHNPW